MFGVKIVILYYSIYMNFKFSKISKIIKIFTLSFKYTFKVICGMLPMGELWGKILGLGVRPPIKQ